MFLFYKEEMVKMLFLGIVCKHSSAPAISALAPHLWKKKGGGLPSYECANHFDRVLICTATKPISSVREKTISSGK